MAEEEIQEPQEEQQQEPAQEPDYKALYEEMKAQSRKWERRSKENADKAKQYDAIQEASKTAEQKLADLQIENERLKAAQARSELVKEVARDTGVASTIVETLSGNDYDTLTAQVKAIMEATQAKGAPRAPEAGKFPRDTQEKSKAEQFAEAFNAALR